MCGFSIKSTSWKLSIFKAWDVEQKVNVFGLIMDMGPTGPSLAITLFADVFGNKLKYKRTKLLHNTETGFTLFISNVQKISSIFFN